MEFLIFNKEEVEEYISKEKYLLISISGLYESRPVLRNDNNRQVLFLKFDDITEKKEPLILFSREKAKEILDFVFEHKSEVKLIVCQCEAGVSRSPGVTAALAEILNGEDKFIFDNEKYLPNMFVYWELLKEYKENYKGS